MFLTGLVRAQDDYWLNTAGIGCWCTLPPIYRETRLSLRSFESQAFLYLLVIKVGRYDEEIKEDENNSISSECLLKHFCDVS